MYYNTEAEHHTGNRQSKASIVLLSILIISIGCGSAWLLNSRTGYLWSVSVTWDELEQLDWPAIKCTFHTTSFRGSTDGTYVMTNGRSRGDAISRSGSETRSYHTITREYSTYSWVDGYSDGLAVREVDVKKLPLAASSPATLSCKGWLRPDPLIFELPKGVHFSAPH